MRPEMPNFSDASATFILPAMQSRATSWFASFLAAIFVSFVFFRRPGA